MRIVTALAAILFAVPALAQTPPASVPAAATPVAAPAAAAAATVEVTVEAIRAQRGEAKSTAPAAAVAQLSKAYPGYGGFSIVDTKKVTLAAGAAAEVPVPSGDKLSVTYVGPAEKLLKLNLVIPDKLKLGYRVNNGGTIFQTLEQGDTILVLSVTARLTK